ncbi:hypothetical protein Trydic_g9108 [Trypoxylus dichotomus]
MRISGRTKSRFADGAVQNIKFRMYADNRHACGTNLRPPAEDSDLEHCNNVLRPSVEVVFHPSSLIFFISFPFFSAIPFADFQRFLLS